MTTEIKLIDRSTLPLTYAAVQENFESPALRSAVFAAAKTGRVLGIARLIALSDRTGLQAVQAVLSAEWSAAGFDSVFVGEADPTIYGDGQIAAYLDQPLN